MGCLERRKESIKEARAKNKYINKCDFYWYLSDLCLQLVLIITPFVRDTAMNTNLVLLSQTKQNTTPNNWCFLSMHFHRNAFGEKENVPYISRWKFLACVFSCTQGLPRAQEAPSQAFPQSRLYWEAERGIYLRKLDCGGAPPQLSLLGFLSPHHFQSPQLASQ